MDRAIINFDAIKLQFAGKIVLREFSSRIKENEKVLLYGKSGSGKSSLARMLLGMIVPDEGSVKLNGKSITPESLSEMRSKIAYVPQNTDIGEGATLEIIESIFSYKANEKIYPERQEILSIFTHLQLDESILYADFSRLSGGEKQRVCIAIALLLKRSIFLLDEPTAALDSEMKERVHRLFLDNTDWTVIVVSHDPIWKDGFRTINLEATE